MGSCNLYLFLYLTVCSVESHNSLALAKASALHDPLPLADGTCLHER
jgi:hypothetical protein